MPRWENRQPKNHLVFKEIKQGPMTQLTYRMPTMEECLKELGRRREAKKCEKACGIGFNVLTASLHQGRHCKKHYRAVLGYILKHNRNSIIFSHLPYSYKEKVPLKKGKHRFKSLREVLKELKERNEAIQRKTTNNE